MRKWLLNLHLYGGLLCSSYLLIYGFSSLLFNHPIDKGADGPAVTWEQAMEHPRVYRKQELAERVRDELGLFGWAPPWDLRAQAGGELRFVVSRPGRQYEIHTKLREGKVQVSETRTGFWSVVRSLHGMYATIPNGPWLVNSWKYYTEVTNWIVLFAAGTGVYLWTARKSERAIGGGLLGVTAAVSLGLILYVWLWG
ncbi:MAG: PepSY domain-containing protein [Phycisphaeraceae bacterium]|nr:PepSY domain-containing protein [Phycisphaeraceae bacterium]